MRSARSATTAAAAARCACHRAPSAAGAALRPATTAAAAALPLRAQAAAAARLPRQRGPAAAPPVFAAAAARAAAAACRAPPARQQQRRRARAQAEPDPQPQPEAAGAEPRREREAPKESNVLKAFVALGSKIEGLAASARGSTLGNIIAPQHQQVHSWGRARDSDLEEDESSKQQRPGDANGVQAAADEEPRKVPKPEKEGKKSLKVPDVPINTTEHAVVPVGEVKDHGEGPESGWDLFKKLMFSKRYKTTAQQATERLYAAVPDFSEPEFLEDVEHNMLPAFLNAFWSKDLETLRSMCSGACFHIDVSTHLKQYEKYQSRCQLLMTRRANLFNRLMFVDDSEYALSNKRKKKHAEGDKDDLDMDNESDLDEDLDGSEVEPEPVFFVSCSAHIINEWADEKTGETRLGDRDYPEDWYFVFGLTPTKNGQWSLSTMEFRRAQAMA
eukprot:TRINITY_DN1462_c0_g1_i1.p1 TRINITY_DN1462_c0_g1~~TRINITY_DN1462_c0_g1_i1.p1  ORF type:complete len:482 (+),score=167.01 TRINITY_DN1462_c0_g1_i1:114-1448(+)